MTIQLMTAVWNPFNRAEGNKTSKKPHVVKYTAKYYISAMTVERPCSLCVSDALFQRSTPGSGEKVVELLYVSAILMRTSLFLYQLKKRTKYTLAGNDPMSDILSQFFEIF